MEAKVRLGRMARPHIREEPSSYYPPRERWYYPVFYLGDALRRGLAMDRFRKPPEVKFGGMIAGLIVPGLAVWLRGPKVWGRAALIASAALVSIFIVWLGYPAANFAFGLLLAVHSTGLVYYCNPMLVGERFLTRLACALLTLLVVGVLLYVPGLNFIQGHLLTPLRMNGRVVVVQQNIQTRKIRRGDWLAYELGTATRGDPHNGGAVLVQSGTGLGPVLALPGDRVAFSATSYSVNGVSYVKLPHMPDSGEVTVAENQWFIWPNLGISGHGNVGEASIATTMLYMASVNNDQLIGKAFHQWFWRKQTLQ
jgi:hypothetical protein